MSDLHPYSDQGGNGYCFECGLSENHPESHHINKRVQRRIAAFIPGGVPKKIRIYDNGGETADRYTAVLTRSVGYLEGYGRQFFYIGMSGAPFHPQGIGMSGEANRRIDQPTYRHLGKRIKWDVLNADVQRCILQLYCDVYDLPMPADAPKPSMTY